MIRRWFRHIEERLGWHTPPVQPGAAWVHAASVGEVSAAASLVEALAPPVLLTVDTDTGRAAAVRLARRIPGLAVGMRPVDLPWTLAPLLAEARPRVLVLVESVSPPVLSRRVRALGAPVVRVSGRVGPRSRRFGRLWAALAPCDRVWARDAEEAAWLGQWFPTETMGDGKGAVRAVNALSFGRHYVVGASTRDGDEARLLAATRDLLVLAPRQPERFDAVASLLADSKRRWVRRSALVDGRVPDDVDVVLLDTLGELAGVLRGARVAFIGGSFSASPGAHSPAEAIAAGVPVVAGPFGGRNEPALAATRRATSVDLADALARPWAPLPVPHDATGRVVSAVEALARVADSSSPRPLLWPLVPPVWLGGWRPMGGWRAPVRVVAIGSYNARGPGRTSLVRWLCGRLADRGERPGAVVRGVGRDRSGLCTSSADPSWRALGDEGALLARDGALVAAGGSRRAAVEALVDMGATVVVLDDGLGSHGVTVDVGVEVVDARFPTARGPLPVGERRPRQRPADVAVWTHVDERFPAPPGAVVAVARPGPWVPAVPLGPVAAVAGLGRQADFLCFGDLLVDRFRALADHQPVDRALAAEIARWADGLPVVTTAKDAVRWDGVVAWRDIVVTCVGSGLDRL